MVTPPAGIPEQARESGTGEGPALDPRGQGSALLLAVASAGAAVGCAVLSGMLGSVLAEGLCWHFVLTALAAVCALIQFRTYRSAWDLKRQEELLESRVGSKSLFARVGGADPEERLLQTQRTLGGLADAAVLLVASGVSVHLLSGGTTSVTAPEAGSAICALIAFASYVGGRYTTALGARARWRPVRPCGRYLTAGGIFAFAGAVAFAGAHAGWTTVLSVADRAIAVWFLLLAGEKALGLLGLVYGLRGGASEPAHSRLVEFVGRPAEATRSLGEALAYNFGLRLTAATLRRFLARVAAPFAAVSAAVFMVLSCFVWIEDGSVGFVERFGAVHHLLEPGLHITAPWPMDRVRVEQVAEVRVEGVGPHFAGAQSAGEPNASLEHAHQAPHVHAPEDGGGAILWTRDHGDQRLFLTPAWGDDEGERALGLVALSASVRYCIGDPARFAYQGAVDAAGVVRHSLRRTLVHITASTDPRRLFGPERDTLSDRVAAGTAALTERCGIRVLSATLEHAHMPVEVAASFESVAEARARSEAAVASAQAESARKTALRAADAQTERFVAEAEAARILAEGAARSRLAVALTPWWRSARRVLRSRLGLAVRREAGTGRAKLIIPDNGDGVTVFEVDRAGGLPFGVSAEEPVRQEESSR